MKQPQKFRKKPVVIDAIRYDGTNAANVSAWAGREHVREVLELHAPIVLAIHTLEGVMRADVGDWIIRGIAGEFYPCKPAIFDATYEPAEL